MVFSLLLALALLFAQQGATLHALGHLAENRTAHPEKHLPDSPACDKCVVYAGIGGAAPSTPPQFADMAVTAAHSVAGHAAPALAVRRFYASRAPPRLA